MIDRDRESTIVRTIAWREVFPWLSLFRVFRVAIAARTLLLAAAGVLITATGWNLIGGIFGTDSPATAWLEPFVRCPWEAITQAVPERPVLPGTVGSFGANDAGMAAPCNITSRGCCPQSGGFGCSINGTDAAEMRRAMTPHWEPRNPISSPWALLTRPAVEGLAHTNLTPRAAMSVLLCGLLSVAVWAFLGAAICRIAAVQLVAEEQVGLVAALRYACAKWPAYFAAPLFPVGGVLLAAIPVLVLGWIMLLGVGLLVAGLVWPLVLLAGLLMAVLLLGTLFGWPLMWATISTEGTDSFDALSRTYAYLFQRPLHYLFYAFVAAAIGWLGWLFVRNFAAGVIWMGYWAAAWGGGSATIDSILGVGERLTGASYFGVVLIRLWVGCVKLLAVGYLFSYFWSAAAAVYLLLRRDVDATEMDEVYLDADRSEQTFDLPKVATDPAGAPAAEDPPAQPPTSDPPAGPPETDERS
jgi:hypothetical protein